MQLAGHAVAQSEPENPFAHWHVNEFTPLMQVPPFLQGREAQLSTCDWQVAPK